MVKKYALLVLILTLLISSRSVDAFSLSLFGKTITFGSPIGTTVIGTRELAPLTITFPKKGSVLQTGGLYTLKWKSPNPEKTGYGVTLINTSTKKETSLGRAYEGVGENAFSFMLNKDIPAGKYKIVFSTKLGGESDVFDIIGTPVLQNVSVLESFLGSVDPLGTVMNVSYRATVYDKSAPATFKIVCPANISAKYLNIERCNTTLPLSVFTQSATLPSAYYLNLAYTNKGASAGVVSMEGFVGSKSIGKGINRIDPTKTVQPTTSIVISKIAAEATTITNNDVDAAVTGRIRISLQPQYGDVPVNSVRGVIGVKNISTGEVIATQSVQGVTESGLTYYQDGSTKMVDFTATFASTTFQLGTTNMVAFLQSLTYRSVTVATTTITTGLELYQSNYTSMYRGSTASSTETIPPFTRNMIYGDRGLDVYYLSKYFMAKGYMTNTTVYNDFYGTDLETAMKKYKIAMGISSTDGTFGPLTRSIINADMLKGPVIITKIR